MGKCLKDLLLENRSIRRFSQSHLVSKEQLEFLVELARLCPSTANRQPLKYFLSFKNDFNEKIFPSLSWAGYLKDWSGPSEGEKPSAYIVILGDKRITNDFSCDRGIVAQTILLGATELGLSGCMIKAFNKSKIIEDLALDDFLEPLLVLAIGKSAEKVILEPLKDDQSIKYWRDEFDIHHVPKRSLYDIIIY